MAGTTTVGKIQYVIDVDTKDFQKGLDSAESSIGKSEGKFKDSFAKIGKAAAAGLAVAATAVAGLAGAAAKSYADYEQLTGGVETLFKGSSDAVKQYAQNAYKTAGLSANQYMETVTGFSASLLQGLGGDTEKAARIGDMAVTDMADNANKMGTSIELVQNAYQGFAKDNYTMLDNLKLGYGGTAGEMARLVNDSGVMGAAFKATAENVKEIPFDKLIEAVHKTQDEMGITGTTAKEASETISGSMSAAKASFQNMLTAFVDGNGDLDGSIDVFMESAGTAFNNLTPVIRTALDSIGDVLPSIFEAIGAELPGMMGVLLPGLINGVLGLVDGLIAAVPGFMIALLESVPTIIQGIIQLIQGVMAVLPQILVAIVNIVIAIVKELTKPETLKMLIEAGITLLLGLVDAIPAIVTALTDAIPEVINSIVELLKNPDMIHKLMDAAIQLFMVIVTALPDIIFALVDALPDLISAIIGFLTDPGTIGLLLKAVLVLGVALLGGLINVLAKAAQLLINSVILLIEGAINVLLAPINLILGVAGIEKLHVEIPKVTIPTIPIPKFASGGVIPATAGGRVVMAGEAGEDEWIIPENKMASLIEKVNASGTAQGIIINVYGTFATSASEQRKVAEQIYDRLQELDRAKFGAMGVA
jgi:hypothetical protein